MMLLATSEQLKQYTSNDFYSQQTLKKLTTKDLGKGVEPDVGRDAAEDNHNVYNSIDVGDSHNNKIDCQDNKEEKVIAGDGGKETKKTGVKQRIDDETRNEDMQQDKGNPQNEKMHSLNPKTEEGVGKDEGQM